MNILSDVFNLHISAECFKYNYNLLLFAALFILVFGLPYVPYFFVLSLSDSKYC